SGAISPVSTSASARVQGRLTIQATPAPAGSADEAGAIDVDRRAGRRRGRVDGQPAHRLGDLGDGRGPADRQVAERGDAAAAFDIIVDHAGDGEARADAERV